MRQYCRREILDANQIKRIKQLAQESRAWKDDGCNVTDEYDTYPPDLFDAAAREEVVIEMCDEIDRLRAGLQSIVDYEHPWCAHPEDLKEIARSILSGRATPAHLTTTIRRMKLEMEAVEEAAAGLEQQLLDATGLVEDILRDKEDVKQVTKHALAVLKVLNIQGNEQ